MTRRLFRFIPVAALACTLPACAHLNFLGWGKAKAPTVEEKLAKGAEVPRGDEEPAEPTDPKYAGKSPYHPQRQRDPARTQGNHVHQTAFPQVEMPPDPPSRPEIAHNASDAKSLTELLPPNPPRPDDPLAHILNDILCKRESDALKHLQRYDQATQDVFLRVMTIIADLNGKGLEKMSPEEIANLQEQFQGLLLTVRTRSALAVETVCLCKDIRGYRAFDPLPASYQFLPARGNRPGEKAVVYAELRNLGTIKRGSQYETRLSATAELTDETGMKVWTKNLQDSARPLFSPVPRTDYLSYTFFLPQVPRPGRHRLTLTVRDDSCRPPRVASKSVDLIIAADGAE